MEDAHFIQLESRASVRESFIYPTDWSFLAVFYTIVLADNVQYAQYDLAL